MSEREIVRHCSFPLKLHYHSPTHSQSFPISKKRDGRTDRPSYRDALMHLKSNLCFFLLPFFLLFSSSPFPSSFSFSFSFFNVAAAAAYTNKLIFDKGSAVNIFISLRANFSRNNDASSLVEGEEEEEEEEEVEEEAGG